MRPQLKARCNSTDVQPEVAASAKEAAVQGGREGARQAAAAAMAAAFAAEQKRKIEKMEAGLYFVSSARVRLMMALQGLGSQVPPKKEAG